MDGGAPDAQDMHVLPSKVDNAPAHDTSSSTKMEENSTVRCSSQPVAATPILPLLDNGISSGEVGAATNNLVVDQPTVTVTDESDSTATTVEGVERSKEGNDVNNVVGDANPAHHTLEHDGDNISTISPVADEKCDTTNAPDDTSSASIKENTATETVVQPHNTAEITPTLLLQEETSSNIANRPPSPTADDHDSSTIMDSIKLTASVVSVSQTTSSSVIVDPESPPTNTTTNESESSSWCNDLSVHQQPHDINAGEQAKETTNDEFTAGGDKNDVLDDDEGDFTVIELVTPNNQSTTPTTTRRFTPIQTTKAATTQLESDGDYNLIPSLAEDTMAPLLPPPASTTTNTTIHPTEYSNTTSPPCIYPQPPLRKKILRHPILTPLTKLPWDKFISAAGACDVLFNCKYSMRQVEDEVREEERKVRGSGDGYHIGYGDGAGGYIDNNGEGAEGEAEAEQGCGNTGREDGYVDVNLGQDCLDYGYDDKEGCEADEFAKLGLDCCSMLDNDDDEEGEGAGHAHPLLQQKQPPLSNSDEMGGERWEHVPAKIGAGAKRGDRTLAQPSESPFQPHRPNAISDDQKAERSWKNSNPSLDMLLYRTMLNE